MRRALKTELKPKVEVVAFVKSAVVPFTLVPVKLVAVRLVAKKLVVVAEVPVASAKSKFTKCEVEDA